MIVNAIPVGTLLAVRYNTSLGPITFSPIMRTCNYSNIKTDAINADVFAVAGHQAGVCSHSLDTAHRVDENELEEE